MEVTMADIPLIAWYIGVLVFLEGLLSADNALVLAVMVRHLSRHDRRRVLQWGIWGAIGFRVVAVLLSTILLKLWYFKVFGGLYLLYLAISHFLSRGHSSEGEAPARDHAPGFADFGERSSRSPSPTSPSRSIRSSRPSRWPTTSPNVLETPGNSSSCSPEACSASSRCGSWCVTSCQCSIVSPGLAEGAYVLVAWIGLKLMISGFFAEKYHIPEWLFWSVMLLIMILSFVIKPKAATGQAHEPSADLDMLETEEEPNENSGAAGDDDPDPGAARRRRATEFAGRGRRSNVRPARRPCGCRGTSSRRRKAASVHAINGLTRLTWPPRLTEPLLPGGAGERYESKTRTFSMLSMFSSMNFLCRSLS